VKTYPLEDSPPGLLAAVEQVKAGEMVVLTDHGQPVARIVPVNAEVDRAAWAREMNRFFARLRERQRAEPTETEIAREVTAHRSGG
jgi:prevent-host-death family protein